MRITSPAFKDNGVIPKKYTCDGENISPPFEIEEVPVEAKSLALIIDDVDAPGGSFIHWAIFNFSPFTSKIEEGNLPDQAATGKNSAGSTNYTGPCPPSGKHRYITRLYALDKNLELQYPAGDEIINAINGCVIEMAELTGIYGRE